MNSWECPFVIIFLWHNIRVGSSTVLGDFTTVYASSHVDKATILPPCVPGVNCGKIAQHG